MKRVNIYLSEVTLSKIKDLAKVKGLKYVEILRRIIDYYFDSQQKKEVK